MYKFVIEGRLPGVNDVVEESKLRHGSWVKWQETKRREQEHIKAAIMAAGRPAMFVDPVEVSAVFYEPNRRRDVDNVTGGGFKLILDALQEAEVIKRDSQAYVKAVYGIVKCDPARPRIVVTVKEIDE